ncbi:hypothetical protein [Candidatus Palauibacter sp.]|uniref:hypothetical protein n=1 Tax=Candidatus Palauibacter sp. TaxID=3101350 RepID=UPI003B5161B9
MIRSCPGRTSKAVGIAAAAIACALTGVRTLEAQGNGRNAHWYMGNYSNEVIVWDEASEEVVDRIPVKRAISLRVDVSEDRSRLYVLDPFFETIEIVALPSKESVGEFTLSEGSTRTWIRSFQVHPDQEWMAMHVQSRTKLADRYRIDDPTLLRFDLTTYEVTDTIPWPDGEERRNTNFRFSPDGDLLYMFADDLVVLDAETFEEVDRWEISEPFEPGLGEMRLPFGRSPYQEVDGVYTGLFRMTDPLQNRRLMGIATVDLAAQDVDFHPIGPDEGVSFVLSPDGTKGYGLKSEIGHYEMWKFDLEGRRVAGRVTFAGRPRMLLMPSADGEKLYVYNAGSTIDVYDEETFEFLRTVTLDADMTSVVVVPDPG